MAFGDCRNAGLYVAPEISYGIPNPRYKRPVQLINKQMQEVEQGVPIVDCLVDGTGAQGAQGAAGAQGAQCAQGAQGAQGTPGQESKRREESKKIAAKKGRKKRAS